MDRRFRWKSRSEVIKIFSVIVHEKEEMGLMNVGLKAKQAYSLKKEGQKEEKKNEDVEKRT
jgi:hypothetical protein